MDQVVEFAKDSINKILQSSSSYLFSIEQLTDVYNHLDQLSKFDLTKNDRRELFCRQLKRLMDCNNVSLKDFWLELDDDILCALEEPNNEQNKGNNWKQFNERMEFELKLKQREKKFEENFQTRKSLYEIFVKYENFFKDYLQKCIVFHAKTQVQGLIGNINNLPCSFSDFTKIKDKLKSIEINIDCSKRSLENFDFHDNSYKPVDAILPSLERIEKEKSYYAGEITNILADHRWIVILGDPGSAKTTLLRWITFDFAKSVLAYYQNGYLRKDNCIRTRIPILIRIGEFAEWIDKHQTKTLIDYIGEHTWFSKRYCHNEDRYILKELIDHGHALILLDGLDEIQDIKQRDKIVEFVREFIEKYVYASDFVSAFDSKMFNTNIFSKKDVSNYRMNETKRPRASNGNQIIVTSRFVGYQICPLIGSRIEHYSLMLIDHTEAKRCMEDWMSQIVKVVFDILRKEKIEIDKQMMEIFSNKRQNAVEIIFENSPQLLKSNPFLLSLMCVCIFQSPDEFHPKSRVEVYNRIIQTAMHSWTNQDSSISQTMLSECLIGLSTYLHLHSPSGLIDEFDTKCLCCFTLQKQGLFENREKQHEYANKLIALLASNAGIVAERGLQIFGFLHLSFQEYFVAQALVKHYSIDRLTVKHSFIDSVNIKDYSIEEITQRILSFTINARFRESLLLALGWISWTWSFDDYNKFCTFLITSNRDYTIPFGTLLLFNAIKDLHILPLKSIIFTALNNLLDHPANIIGQAFLLEILSQLPEDIIKEWMTLYLNDDKAICKFCRCFRLKYQSHFFTTEMDSVSVSSVVLQQLSSLQHRSPASEIIIDQTLRNIMTENGSSNDIFDNKLPLYLSSIHPLILSTIIAVYGGIRFGRIESSKERVIRIDFSPKQIHRNSSILPLIVKYFSNNEEFDLNKLQLLINAYENELEKFSPLDTSVNVVDILIALICLQGVSQPLIYQKYENYQALSFALNRLKWTWYYFNEFFKHCKSNLGSSFDTHFIQGELELIMGHFLSQFDQQYTSFSIACASAWKNLGLWDLEKSLCFHSMKYYVDYQFSRSHPEFIHLFNEQKLNEMSQNIDSLQISEKERSILLTFLPRSLQRLYYFTTIAPKNNTTSLPFVVYLLKCLVHLENLDEDDLNFYLILPRLHTLLKKHMLENYGSMVFQERYYYTDTLDDNDVNIFLQDFEDRELLDSFISAVTTNLDTLINVERQRIREVETTAQNQDKDVKLFAASISLARLFQSQYRFHENQKLNQIILLPSESEEVYSAIGIIFNPILRLIALNIILNMQTPFIFDEEQRDKLREEIILLLEDLIPNLPLLISTFLFVHCYSICQFFPKPFQHLAHFIGGKLNQLSDGNQNEEQQAAYIALRQLNNPDLSDYLSIFEKQTENLSDLLLFNSTIFYQYFTNTKLFDSLNTTLLSSMYLMELTFDAQILRMYTKNNSKDQTLYLKDLWNDSSKIEKIMTFKVALWITNYLETSDRKELQQIINDMSCCLKIVRSAISVIEKWLKYQMDENLRFFVEYAALQLVYHGSTSFDLINIINNMFVIDCEFHLKSLVENLFVSQYIDLTILRSILVTLHENSYYFSKIFVSVDREEIFELILKLELQRILNELNKIKSIPFLSIIKGCSENLQLYLVYHLRKFIKSESQIENCIKEEYIAIVIKWIIEICLKDAREDDFSRRLYKYIFVLLHNHRFPQVQKAIINAFNSVFLNLISMNDYRNIFFQDYTIENFRKVICSWRKYSEDVLSDCLLTYGNCLLKLKMLHKHRTVPNKIKNRLHILFKTSSSETISIRAGFCLIFLQHTDITFDEILNWFSNRLNLNVKTKYKMLLEQSWYDIKDGSYAWMQGTFRIHEHLKIYSAELMELFVSDLYKYLCNNDNGTYLYDFLPNYFTNYIKIAAEFNGQYGNEFRNAVEKSCLGEKEFKMKLSLHCKNSPRDSDALIQIYISFGIVTNELVDMLKISADDRIWYSSLGMEFRHLKQVSDREVVENLFKLLNSKMSDQKFELCFRLLTGLAQNGTVSLLELHQTIPLIINNMSLNEQLKNIYRLLLDLSCIKNYFAEKYMDELFTENHIEEKFKRENENIDRRSNLFLRKDYFISD